MNCMTRVAMIFSNYGICEKTIFFTMFMSKELVCNEQPVSPKYTAPKGKGINF